MPSDRGMKLVGSRPPFSEVIERSWPVLARQYEKGKERKCTAESKRDGACPAVPHSLCSPAHRKGLITEISCS